MSVSSPDLNQISSHMSPLQKQESKIIPTKLPTSFGLKEKRNSAPQLHLAESDKDQCSTHRLNLNPCFSQRISINDKSQEETPLSRIPEVTNRATLTKMRKEEFRLEQERLIEQVRNKDLTADKSLLSKSKSLQNIMQKFKSDKVVKPVPKLIRNRSSDVGSQEEADQKGYLHTH